MCFSVSRHIPRPVVCVSHFHDFQFSRHTPGTTVCIFHVPRFYCISPYSRSVFVSFFTYFRFLAILQVLQCAILISMFLSFSNHIAGHLVFVSYIPYFSVFFCHTPGPTVCFSHFPRFWVFLAIFQIYPVCFSFYMVISFLTILQVLECAFLIFHGFEGF
jgi:hypothetical protein